MFTVQYYILSAFILPRGLKLQRVLFINGGWEHYIYVKLKKHEPRLLSGRRFILIGYGSIIVYSGVNTVCVS